MAYVEYEYGRDTTLKEVAETVGISPSELAKINNLPTPTINKLSQNPFLHGTILVPDIYNGRESFENSDRSDISIIEVDQLTRNINRNVIIGSHRNSMVGFASEGACYIKVDKVIYIFPCYPESFSDTRQSHFSGSQNPLGRSEPFQIYENSGPRTVSVTFKMHREMFNDDNMADGENLVDRVVAGVQSATYPLGYGDHIPPKVTLVIGNACQIEGIIADQVSANWSDTIIDHRYQMVELSFTVTEVTGNPKTLGTSTLYDIAGYTKGSMRNRVLV